MKEKFRVFPILERIFPEKQPLGSIPITCLDQREIICSKVSRSPSVVFELSSGTGIAYDLSNNIGVLMFSPDTKMITIFGGKEELGFNNLTIKYDQLYPQQPSDVKIVIQLKHSNGHINSQVKLTQENKHHHILTNQPLDNIGLKRQNGIWVIQFPLVSLASSLEEPDLEEPSLVVKLPTQSSRFQTLKRMIYPTLN